MCMCVFITAKCVRRLRSTHAWQERDALLSLFEGLATNRRSARMLVEAGAVALVSRILLGTGAAIKGVSALGQESTEGDQGWVVCGLDAAPRRLTDLRDLVYGDKGVRKGGGVVDMRPARVKYVTGDVNTSDADATAATVHFPAHYDGGRSWCTLDDAPELKWALLQPVVVRGVAQAGGPLPNQSSLRCT